MIRIANLHSRYKLDECRIKRIARRVLRYMRKTADTDLELVFLSDARIRSLNKAFMSRDIPTDVLSFGIDTREFGNKTFLGEIFISIDRARENAVSFGAPLGTELTRYIIHAILHLFGYDDDTARARHRMSRKEDELLEHLCRLEDLSKVLTLR